MTADTEIELKLDIDQGDMDALLHALARTDTAVVEREQVATYFDTPDGDLRAAGVSLRVRHAAGRYVQTIKADNRAAAGLFARAEWERDVAGNSPELDDDLPLRTLVPDDVLDALRPAFTVHVSRRQWQVIHDGADIELVADRGHVEADGRSSAVSEIELELKSGSAAALFAVARDLGGSMSLRLGVLTKSERGYRLLAGRDGRRDKAQPLHLAPGTATADAFAQIVADCLRQFRLNEDALRQRARPEVLHQARVALRRLRSALSIFKPVVDDGELGRMREDLRWLAGTLGEARDLDVLIGRWQGEGGDRLGEARDRAYAAAMEALASERSRWLMIDLTRWAAMGAWRTHALDPALPAAPAEHFAADTLDRLRRRVKRRGRDLMALSDEERHRVRIDAKKLRYAAGFFADLFPGKKAAERHAAFLLALEDLQQHLGDLNDLATAPEVLARVGIAVPDQPSDRDRATLLANAAAAHAAFADSKRFWR